MRKTDKEKDQGYKDRAIKRLTRKIVIKNGCHLYSGCLGYSGYGIFTYRRKHIKAHRAAYMLFSGDIPMGMHVLHSCDVRNCINPAHLRLGTQVENNMDRDIRNPLINNPNRFNVERGSGRYNSILTEVDIPIIRASISDGEPLKSIGARFGVTYATIREIKVGNNWRHVQMNKEAL